MIKNLSNFVEATASKFNILGSSVGVWAKARKYAWYGVTSIDNPLFTRKKWRESMEIKNTCI